MKHVRFWIITAAFVSSFFCSLQSYAGIKVPPFAGADLSGTQHSLEDYKGKVVVLYFWATWCPGCRRDTENVKKVYEQFHPKGIEFVSVSLDKDLNKLKEYVAAHKIEFPVLFEGKAWDNPLADAYSVSSTPSFFIISPEGEMWGAGHWSDELSNWLGRIS